MPLIKEEFGIINKPHVLSLKDVHMYALNNKNTPFTSPKPKAHDQLTGWQAVRRPSSVTTLNTVSPDITLNQNSSETFRKGRILTTNSRMQKRFQVMLKTKRAQEHTFS